MNEMYDYDILRREVSLVTYRVHANNFEGAAAVNLDDVEPMSRTLVAADICRMEQVRNSKVAAA